MPQQIGNPQPPLGATILESYVQSKTGNEADCEDVIHISEHFIAVIDGATSKPVGEKPLKSLMQPFVRCLLIAQRDKPPTG